MPTIRSNHATHATHSSTAPPAATSGNGVLLADALSINALSSGGTGLVLALGAPWLAGPLGTPAWLLAVLGVGLVVFAFGIVVALHRPQRLRAAARWIIAADVAWVLGAVAVVAADLLTPLGSLLLLAVTAAVACFAAAQVVGLRRTGDGPAGLRPVVLTAEREVDADPDAAWALVSDAAGYEAVAPGIAATVTDGPVGDGMVRTCTDEGGRSWQEHCALLEPGRAYRMEVDTSTYPLRHRAVLHSFGMTWRVIPTARGTRLVLRFSGLVKLGVLGRLAMAALARGAPHERIVEAYAAQLAA